MVHVDHFSFGMLLSKNKATQSEVTRISQELEVSEMFSGSNESLVGSPGPVGPPGANGPVYLVWTSWNSR